MEEKRFPYRVSSITLSTAILVTSCILAITLFANQRSSNVLGSYFGTLIYLGSCVLLIFELWKTDILPKFLETLKAKIIPCTGVERDNSLLNYEVIRPSKIHNYLAWGFSVGYFLFHSWRIANDFYYLFDDRIECFNVFNVLQDIAKLVIAALILLAMVNKERISQSNNLSSYFVWPIVGATCFYAAFSYIVEEMVWAYISIIQKSIDDPGFGLDIPANITRGEDYIEELFKMKAICLQHSLWARVSFRILTMVPFSAQYFSLACFFSYMVWRNLDYEVPEFHDQHDLDSPLLDDNSSQENNEAIQDRDDEIRPATSLQRHNYQNLPQPQDLLLSFSGAVTIIFSISLVIIATITIFHIGMEKGYRSESIWLYHGQVSILRLIIFIIEWT
ncbi:uncharacterized protein LOC118433793 [Folsomia candida]|uniref:Uncharacterized protein n=1 Tax=Folsomia candida TaxID=158441 RepID=A0A226F0U0_FOLCA|nr:uncharacterized protein LOC118433793 [Folsomia candida]OXA62546.1 hypothetical protein Fcan01_00329 [Folsomia candida]